MYKTPILLDLKEKNIFDFLLSFEENNIYSIKIYSPKAYPFINNSINSFIFNTFYPLKGILRIELPPSIGEGLDSCYKIEYYKHSKAVENYDSTKLKTEFWYVPTIDKTYLRTKKDYLKYKPNITGNKISLICTSNIAEVLLEHPEIIQIKSVIYKNKSINFELIDHSINTDIESTLHGFPDISLKLDYDSSILPGEEYIIEYYDPFTRAELLYRNTKYMFNHINFWSKEIKHNRFNPFDFF
jgi:hypothetical protein